MATSLAALLAAAALALVLPPAVPAGAAPTTGPPSAPPPPSGAVGPVRYEPPVDAPVADPFRPPRTRWGPGNRGIEYTTEPGTTVRAAAVGTVVFAGSVAGALHVTVEHADGIRTSYSFLASVAVRRGQRVRLGQTVGTSGARLHVGARVGDAYIDPALLFAGGLRLRVRLVPHHDPARAARVAAMDEASERELLAALATADGGGVFDVLAGGAGMLLDLGGERVRLVWHYAVEPAVTDPVLAAVAVVDVVMADQGPCTAASVRPAPPTERRVAVLVGGLNSSDADAAVEEVDTARHGYEPGDVVRFSYAGGAVPRPPTGGWADGLPTAGYSPDDTRGAIGASGLRLADLLERVVAATPGVPVDLYAHSMGGLVLRAALAELGRRGARLPDVVVTLGTPHRGADLATAGTALRLGPLGPVADVGLDAIDAAGESFASLEQVADIDPTDPALRQLSEVSTFVDTLPPIPAGIDALSIGARTDLIVPAPRVRGSGVPTVIVDGELGLGAHDSLPGSEAANREIALHLAGMPPSCRGRVTRLGDLVVGALVSEAEDTLGRAVATTWFLPGAAPVG